MGDGAGGHRFEEHPMGATLMKKNVAPVNFSRILCTLVQNLDFFHLHW